MKTKLLAISLGMTLSTQVFAAEGGNFKCLKIADRELQSVGLGTFSSPSTCTQKKNDKGIVFSNEVGKTKVELVSDSSSEPSDSAYTIHIEQTDLTGDTIKNMIQLDSNCAITYVGVRRGSSGVALIDPANCKSFNKGFSDYRFDWSKMRNAEGSGFKNSGLSLDTLKKLCAKYVPNYASNDAASGDALREDKPFAR